MSEHGTRSRFINSGCRCLPCRAAQARYQAEYKARVRSGEWKGNEPLDKTLKLIRRLEREGFTRKEIGRRLGRTALTFKKKIRPERAARIEAFYNMIMAE